ncbi:ATP-binding protein, partial [Saccharothrix coeruleofusca]|uniref:ATP-binding protein n=1 Tax=Saccharothrix coeruleofusca TaxID=33919 RepID=UPI001E54F6C8
RGEDVARAVLAALGLREDGTGPVTEPAQRVVAALSRGSVLLVLDNCEHVVESVAVLVARLLAGCARVRVLATSREALGVTGEVVRPVPPLGLPEHDGRWSDSPAVRLFAERAAAVRPGFRVADDVASVVAVCRALEGLPLAIELAAARVRSLPVAELARRVHDRFGLLSRGSRGAAARHRTLHAVVEWSWELLDEPERRLARWLTVFRGGATPAAVRAVCGAQAEELLSALADKSLVELAGDRYRMLETIREFCARELVACGESQRAGRAHAEYFLELIGRSGPRLRRAEQVVQLGRLAGEHENFRAAARWAARHDPVLALRLVAELGWYFWLRGMRSQGSALAEEVLAAVGPRAPLGAEQEHLLCRLIGVSDGRARVELAGVPERWGAPDFPDPPRYPFLTLLWGMAHGAPQLEGEELEGYRRALVGQDAWSRALVELGAGMQHQYNGLVEQAWQAHRRALAGFRELGERWGASLALSRLADLAAGRGEPRRAVELVGRALALAEELGATEDVAALLGQRACWLERVGACSSARRDLERAAELARRAGSVEALAAAWLGLAELARRRGRSREALRWCREALRVCPSDWFGPAEVRAQARVCLGRLAAARGEVEGARREWAAALDSAVRWGNRVVLAGVAEARAAAEAGPPPSPDSDIDIDSDAGVESESGVEEGVVAGGDARRVAVLLGAAATLRGAADPADPEVRWVLRWARRRLGGDFEALFAQGAGMSREQVLAVLRA